MDATCFLRLSECGAIRASPSNVRLGCTSLGEVCGLCRGNFFGERAIFRAGAQIDDVRAHILHSSSGSLFAQMRPIGADLPLEIRSVMDRSITGQVVPSNGVYAMVRKTVGQVKQARGLRHQRSRGYCQSC
jgi:hypothetical protein